MTIARDLTGLTVNGGVTILRQIGRRNNRPLYAVRCRCGVELEAQQPHIIAASRGKQSIACHVCNPPIACGRRR